MLCIFYFACWILEGVTDPGRTDFPVLLSSVLSSVSCSAADDTCNVPYHYAI